jgi:hypothetical protein
VVPPEPVPLFWSTIVPEMGRIVGFGVSVSMLPAVQVE